MDEALTGLGGAGIVWAIVGVLKQAFILPDRLLPLLALGLGIAWNVGLRAAAVTDLSYGAAAIMGVTTGLAASGIWAQARKLPGGQP